jgi:hypothetical protein
VRTGLVVLGVVIAVLGAGLVLSLFILDSGASTTTLVSPSVPSLSPQGSQSWDILGTQSSTATVSLSWFASGPADVSLVPGTPCSSSTGYCPTGNYSLNWTSATSGKGTLTGLTSYGYLLMVHNPGTKALSFSATVSVTFARGSSVPTWTWGLIAGGGITLLAIGGVALFLGLFLAPGVYDDPDGEVRAVRHPSLPPEEHDPDFIDLDDDPNAPR